MKRMTVFLTTILLFISYNFLCSDGMLTSPEHCFYENEDCGCIRKEHDTLLQCVNLKGPSDLQKLTTALWEPLVNANLPTSKSKGHSLSLEFQIMNSNLSHISHHVLLNICYFKSVNLSHNSIHIVEPKTFPCNKTERFEELDLSNNYLTEVSTWFTRSLNLKRLHLERNNLHTIKVHAFEFLENLQVLNLSFNIFTVIRSHYFHNMMTLKFLTLAHNNISVIEVDAFQHLANLTTLDLSFNNFHHLDTSVFLPLHKLFQLSLAHNQLVVLNGTVFSGAGHLRQLHLEGNPWACNDSMMWLYHNQQISHLELAPNGTDALCFSPEDMQNKTVHQWIEVKIMEESFHRTRTCQICSCSVDKNRDNIVAEVNCKGKGLSQLPELLPNNTKVVRMENNNLKLLASNTVFLDEWQNVMYLYLNNNSIESLKGIEGTRLVQNLALLNLTGNRLREIPVHILDQFSETLHDLYLGDNPWDCDCKTVRFQNWLRYHYKQVRDMERIHCGPEEIGNAGKAIYKLMKSDLCPQVGEGVNYLDILNVVMAILIVTILSKLILDYMWQKRTGKLPHFFSFRLH